MISLDSPVTYKNLSWVKKIQLKASDVMMLIIQLGKMFTFYSCTWADHTLSRNTVKYSHPIVIRRTWQKRKENFTNVWLTLELKQVLTTGGRSDTNVTSPFREQSFILLSKQFPPLSMTETVNSIRVKKHPFLTAYMTLWGLFWSVFESVYSNYIPAGVVYKLSQL